MEVGENRTAQILTLITKQGVEVQRERERVKERRKEREGEESKKVRRADFTKLTSVFLSFS